MKIVRRLFDLILVWAIFFFCLRNFGGGHDFDPSDLPALTRKLLPPPCLGDGRCWVYDGTVSVSDGATRLVVVDLDDGAIGDPDADPNAIVASRLFESLAHGPVPAPVRRQCSQCQRRRRRWWPDRSAPAGPDLGRFSPFDDIDFRIRRSRKQRQHI